jgi:hypothetical protein
LVAFGKHSALYNFLFAHLPYFNKFRVPVMILILLQLAVAVLPDWADRGRRGGAGSRAPRPHAALDGRAARAHGVRSSRADGRLWRDAYTRAALASRPQMDASSIDVGYRGFAGDLVRCRRSHWSRSVRCLAPERLAEPAVAIGIVGAITLFDLLPVDNRLMKDVIGPPTVLTAAGERDEVIDYLVAQKPLGEFRVFPVREFQGNRYAGFGLASLGGYHAAKPKLYQAFLDANQGRLVQSPIAWRLLNVEYIIYPGLLPPSFGLTEVFRGQQDVVYKYAGALPRATLVPAYRIVPREQQLAAYTDTTSDPAKVTLLAEEPGITPVPGGTVKIDRYGLNKVELTTDTPGPSILRLADLAFPGWKVTIDGREAKPLVADYMLRAVAVPTGRHAVVWEFHDPAFERGLRISVGAFVVILLLYLVPWLIERRRKVQPVAA